MTETLTLASRAAVEEPFGVVDEVPRWRPSRAGLIALWRYWDETFTFHRGRLLLRGPNGAGKSMALELLLPFLLDADSSPSRLTSAAKPRGGLYDRVMTGSDDPSRTGYAWLEFTRGPEAFTVGVRLRTSTATRRVDSDFFTTSQRVGVDLRLLSPDRVPLSRADLKAALGDHGELHRSNEEHRAAVRKVLFAGFSPDRYASVITSLLALRKEKLSQNLDLAKLSQVLSEALAPVDEHDLAAVAEGFERLDRRRTELTRLQDEVREVRQLAARQRDYAQAVLRTLTGEVRAAESRRDDVTRQERQARAALEEATSAADDLERQAEAVEARLAAVEVERYALHDRDAYREGVGLADLRTSVRNLAESNSTAATAVDRGRQAVADAESRAVEARQQATDAAANLRQAWTGLEHAGERVGADGLVAELTPEPGRSAPAHPSRAEEGRRLVEAWTGSRRRLVAELRTAIAAYERAVQQRDFTQGLLSRDEEALDERHQAEVAARGVLAEADHTFAVAVTDWAGAARAVPPDRLAAVLPLPPEGPEQVRAVVQSLATELRAEHEVAVASLAVQQRQIATERVEVAAERDRFATGDVVEPVPPPWRDDRTGRAGAPLWRLVELREHATAATVDGLESALTGSGLLDAWVSPAGTVDLAGHPADVTLTRSPASGETLADWLAPLPADATADPLVAPEVVAAVLGSLAVRPEVTASADCDAEVVLARDGRFRLGAAVGRGPGGGAALLGAEARERRRLARLAELEAQLQALERRRDGLDRDLADRGRRQAAMVAELQAVPDGAPVVEARTALALAEVRARDAADRLEDTRSALAEAEQAVREALRALTALGARHGLPTDRDALAEVEGALATLVQAVAAWSRRAGEAHQAGRTLVRDEEVLARSRNQAAAAESALGVQQRQHDEADRRLSTLEANVGAAYAEIVAQLADLDRERGEQGRRRRALGMDIPRVQKRIGALETTVAQAEQARADAEQARAEAHRRFVAALGDGLAADAQVAVPDALDGVTAVLAASREVAAALGAARRDHEVEWTNARLDERLHQARGMLRDRFDLDRRPSEGWWVLSARVAGLRNGITDVVAALDQELGDGQREFHAEEERLFEQVLAGSVRRALTSRIRLATELVDGINAQLDRVKTAAGGVAVRLRWDVDPDQPGAVRSARALLLRDPHDLTEAEAAALQEFVRARVEQARADLEPAAPWEARLRETLDYRSWHRFTLQVAHRDWDGYQPATANRLQRLSTGERSIALHLPMMASVAAHYADERGEPSGCPRLILLDELFAGVDPANRAQLFGTFTAWDLDAVFTSDHEWCQYASLDGIAIHHLHPAEGDAPVTSTRFTWDGRRRLVEAVP